MVVKDEPGGFEILCDGVEESLAVVSNRRGLAVDNFWCSNNTTAKHLSDTLLAHTHAQNRTLSSKIEDDRT